MMRLAASVLVIALVAFPLGVLPWRPFTWLAVLALIAGGAGIVAWSVPLVTVGGSIALIAYALALVIAQPAVDPIAATAFGATLVLLLALVHFGGRVQGATIGAAVMASQIRQWLVIVTAGVVAAIGLTAAAALGRVLQGLAAPVVVVIAALGALVTAAAAIALVTARPEAHPRLEE